MLPGPQANSLKELLMQHEAPEDSSEWQSAPNLSNEVSLPQFQVTEPPVQPELDKLDEDIALPLEVRH